MTTIVAFLASSKIGMKCTDCGNGTPSNAWLRCVECAMGRLRVLMSGGAVTVSATARRWQRGDRVLVKTEGIEAIGTIVRERNESFTITLDRGGRCYASRRQLFPVPVACDVQTG